MVNQGAAPSSPGRVGSVFSASATPAAISHEMGSGRESNSFVQRQTRYSAPHLNSTSFATGAACLVNSGDEGPVRKKAGYQVPPSNSGRPLSPESHGSFHSGSIPRNRSPSHESAWDAKKRTINSSRMQSGDDMRLTLSQAPAPTLRRMNSMPPRLWRPDDENSSVVSIVVASTSAREAGSSISAHVKETNFWRVPSQEEDQRVPRLRSDGATIGNRGKASCGIPWRQIPSYGRNGLLGETGDPYPQDSKKAVEMDYKKKAHFSQKLAGSNGIKSTLGVLQENCESTLPFSPVRRETSPRGAWLEVVRRRQEAKMFPADQVRAPISFMKCSSGEPACIADLHMQWRQQRKTVHAPEALKDACPYYREDSAPDTRVVQPPTPHKRCNLSTSPRVGSASSPYASVSSCDVVLPQSEPLPSSERVSEARRDWQYCQDKADCGAHEEGLLGESASGSACMNRCGSVLSVQRSGSIRSFSTQTASSVQHPVHSIRARPPGPQKPRWK